MGERGFFSGMFTPRERVTPPVVSSEKAITKPEKQGLNLEERLSKGEYRGTLETYKVKWDIEKVARDTLQNFFDANGGTLDSVPIEIQEVGEGEQKRYTVRIEGSAEYDYRKLLHLGGTSKDEGATTAGGFGEGTKVLSLVLLRDFGFSDVTFGSSDWKLSFYLDEVPKDEYDKPARGLFTRLAKEKKSRPGNFISFTTNNKQSAEAFVKARDLFRHSENPDFKEPTYEGPDGSGFKFLGPEGKGHLYDAGQRRHFEDASKGWDAVEGVHIWTKDKRFGSDRDRGSVSRYEVDEKVVKPMVDGMNEQELESVLHAMEEMWPVGSTWGFGISDKVMHRTVEALAAKGKTITFDDKCLASEPFMSQMITDNLRAEGYVICRSYFDTIGMRPAKERFLEMQKHFRVEPEPEQKRRMDLLRDAIQEIKRYLEESGARKEIKPKDIWIFNRKDEKSIFQGQYDEEYVWITNEVIDGEFAKALAIYLHELDHRFGTDQSEEFSYALTDTLELVLDVITDHPESFKKIKSEWRARTAYEKAPAILPA